MRGVHVSILLLFNLLLAACATPYGVYADKRPLEVIKDDISLRSDVGDALHAEGYTGVNEISVHSYFGSIFLTGELPAGLRAKAVRTAEAVRGVRSVTAHWFVSMKAEQKADAALKLRLEKNLIAAEGVTSSRIDHVVNSGRVVLLGVVGSDAEKNAAYKAARATKGARAVTSYIFVRGTL